MFADDAVIGSENREQVEDSMERWGYGYVWNAVEARRNTCVCKGGDTVGEVNMQGAKVVKVDEFKYLGSTVQSKRQCTREMKKRV